MRSELNLGLAFFILTAFALIFGTASANAQVQGTFSNPSPSRSLIFQWNENGGEIQIYDVNALKYRRPIEVGYPVNSLLTSPSEQFLCVNADLGKRVLVYDLTKRRPALALQLAASSDRENLSCFGGIFGPDTSFDESQSSSRASRLIIIDRQVNDCSNTDKPRYIYFKEYYDPLRPSRPILTSRLVQRAC